SLINEEKEVQVVFLNSSDYPAIGTTTQILWFAADSVDFSMFEPSFALPSSSGNVAPRSRISCRSKTGKEDMPELFMKVKTGQTLAYIFGQVSYTDLDGNSYQSRFCSQWVPSTNEFIECPKSKFVEGQKLKP